jgi:hypothetical protein
MLTDDEIKDLKALTRFADRHSVFTCDPQTVHELATRLLSAEARVRELEKAERAAYERGRQDASPTLGISPLR